MKVSDLEQGQDVFTFVSDSQDVEAIRDTLGAVAEGYDSFFVRMGEGDYEEVYGMEGTVPKLCKNVDKIL